MRVEVALAILVVGCGVPVDIGMLEDTTSGGSGGPVTEDTTLSDTDSMTGPVQMTSTPDDTSSSDSEDLPPPVQRDFAIVEGPAVDTSTGSGTGGEEDTGGGGEQTTTVGTSASSTTGDTGDEFEPGTLRIYATTGTATCADPFGVEPCPATWTYRFSLPPDQQFVGASGRLEDNDGFATEVGGELVDCSGGGGSLFGSFEITAIDDAHVAGRMFDLELTMWATEVVFDASICAE